MPLPGLTLRLALTSNPVGQRYAFLHDVTEDVDAVHQLRGSRESAVRDKLTPIPLLGW